MKDNYQEDILILNILAKFYLSPPSTDAINCLIENSFDALEGSYAIDWQTLTAMLKNLASSDKLENEIKEQAADHLLLLVGLGMPKAPPWGSVYLHDENLLLQDSTFALKAFVDENQLEFKPLERQPIDHIGFCLEILALLLERVDLNQHNETPKRNVRIFLSQHLLPWINCCLTLLITYAETDFYRLIGLITQNLINDLATSLNASAPENVKIYF